MNLKDHFAAVNSEEVEEILNSKPKWIVRHGLLLIVIFSVILAVLAGFIRYPDVLKTDVVLTSTSPPVKLVARSDGKIESFLVKEGQQVKEGDIVATIASSGDIQDIIYLKTIVEAFHRSPDTAFLYSIPKFNQNLQLGELQPSFTELVQTIDIYNNFKRDKGYANNIEMSNEKLKFAQKIEKEIRNKGSLLGEQLASESKKLHSHESLLKDKVIAPLEFEEIKKKYLDQKMALDNNNTAILENLTLQQGIGE